MPQELTRYSVSTTQLTVERPGQDVSWGATFVENTARVGNSTVRSLLVSDLADNGIMETAGVKCGDVILKLNGEDMARWTYEEMVDEINLQTKATLTLITYQHQQTKYLLFLDLSPGDITNIWALNNLVSLHICGTKLKNGIVDLRGITCKGVLQELAVTKSELDSVNGVMGLEMFTKLRRLNLTHNRLTSLDEEVMLKLTSLEELRLGNNNLNKFPLVVTEMTQLRDLSLVYNLISVIPEQILRMQNLENLHLDNNYLSEMPDFVTQQLSSLSSLTFSSNQLAWDEDYVRECFHLKLVDFSENGIRARTALDNFGVVGRATLRRKGRNLLREPSLLKLALARSA
ncbi:hypothetical protein ACHWQZ_G002536 [Mnemiopsis leidyi]